MVWLGGVDRGVWLRVPAGCSVGCRGGVRRSGTLTGEAGYRALLGWGLLVPCCVSAFCGGSWASTDRALWSACWPDFYLILMNITSTQCKQTPSF